MYDVTDKESFYALESWHEQIKNDSEESVVIMLLANKCDLPDKQITYEMGKDYAAKKGFGFLEVSAKQDINIKNSFQGLVQSIYKVYNQDFQIPRESNTMLKMRTNSI